MNLLLSVLLATALSTGVEVGQVFPDFTLKDLQGRSVSLHEFRGKIVILDFWMSTCPPCRKEMPMFQRFQTEYRDRGVVVIGVGLDSTAKVAKKFAGQVGARYTLLLHPTLMTDEAEQSRYGIVGLPTTYIIDREGIVRAKVIGFEYEQEFRKALALIVH